MQEMNYYCVWTNNMVSTPLLILSSRGNGVRLLFTKQCRRCARIYLWSKQHSPGCSPCSKAVTKATVKSPQLEVPCCLHVNINIRNVNWLCRNQAINLPYEEVWVEFFFCGLFGPRTSQRLTNLWTTDYGRHSYGSATDGSDFSDIQSATWDNPWIIRSAVPVKLSTLCAGQSMDCPDSRFAQNISKW